MSCSNLSGTGVRAWDRQLCERAALSRSNIMGFSIRLTWGQTSSKRLPNRSKKPPKSLNSEHTVFQAYQNLNGPVRVDPHELCITDNGTKLLQATSMELFTTNGTYLVVLVCQGRGRHTCPRRCHSAPQPVYHKGGIRVAFARSRRELSSTERWIGHSERLGNFYQ